MSEHTGWWRQHCQHVGPEYAALLEAEQTATHIMHYHPSIIPGLLQTAGMARELFDNIEDQMPGKVGDWTRLRLARQDRMLARDDVRLTFIIDESALRRKLKDQEEQETLTGRIRAIAERPNIEVGVLPLSADLHPAVGGPLSIMRRPEGDLLYLEGAFTDQVSTDQEMIEMNYRRFLKLKELAVSGTEAMKFL